MFKKLDRRAFLGASAMLLATPYIGRANTADATLYDTAKADGRVTWYTSHYNAETAERIRQAFMTQYPGIEVNLLRLTTQVAFQRLSQELDANALECDVFGTSDIGHFVDLKARDLLLQFTPENAATMLEVYRDIDPDGYFHATSAGTITITRNTALVAAEDVPGSWDALLDPKWAGRISVGHPGYSGYVGTWAVAMRKIHGDAFFSRLADLKPRVGRSIQDTVTNLVSGECALAAGNIASTLASAERGNPLAISYPSDGVVLIDSPSAILRTTRYPNASKLLVEFLASAKVSEIMTTEFGETMHIEVAPNPAAKPLHEIASLHLSVDEISTGIPEVVEVWRDVFGL